MATVGLYGSSSAGVVPAASGAESTGLYGNNVNFGGSYFEWFIFQEAATQPATPTGGSWSFTSNSGTPPTGWSASPPSVPSNQIWVSIALVNSKTTSSLTWSAPGLFSYSAGLPVLSGTGAPSSGLGQDSQVYVQTDTSPQSIWFKESGAWVRLTGDVVAIANGGTGATTAAGARTNLGAAASGANSDITNLSGITGGISTADYLQLDTAITPAPAVAKLQWDTTWNGPQIGMGGGNVNLQIGQETLIYVYNNTGSDLTDGQIVYVTGSQGQRVTVALAQANADSTSATIIGMVTEPIANNASGFVTTQGMVSNINTSGAADGAVVYLSPTTAGAWTTTKPQAPNHIVMVGYIVKGGSGGAGSIYIHPQNGYEIDELHDVKITSRAAYNLLQVDPTNSYWQNVAGPSGAVVGTTDVQTLTNKTISGASNTLTNIGNSSLTNSSISFTYSGGISGSASTSLGGTNALSLSAIPNASLANSSITVNGSSVSLGGSVTVSSNTTNALTIGTGLSGTSFNGSAPVTIAIDSTVATLSGTQTLTNKTISGSSNTLTNIANSSLTNSSVTVNGSAISLGGSATITAANPNALTIGTGLSGSSYTGSSAVTIAIDSTVATLTGTQTLTNKTLTNPTVTNYTETQTTANTGTAITLNLADGTVDNLTLTGNTTITMPTAAAGKSFIVYLKTGTGGFSVTWSTVKWPAGTAPTVTSTASRMDIYSFFSDGTNWYGTTVGQNYTP